MSSKLEGTLSALTVGLIGYFAYNSSHHDFIEEDCPCPSEICIKSRLDEDGKKQTILEYKGSKYLIKSDRSGNLRFLNYDSTE